MQRRALLHCLLLSVANHGGENGPVTVAAFKAADSALRTIPHKNAARRKTA